MQWIDEIHTPEKVTITTVVFIPFLSGYWEKSLDVLKNCIDSIVETMESTFDLMVFDNGSCDEVLDYLYEAKRDEKIQYLLLSEKNLGKVGAWNVLFSAAQGEIIVYTDSDALFSKGWFEESMKLLEAFPKAGMITAQPARGRPNFSDVNSSTIKEAKQDPSVEIREGKLISGEILEKVRIGLGYSEDHYQKNKVEPYNDIELSKDGQTAYVSASHFQFLSKKSTLEQVIPLIPEKTYGGDQQLDEKINELEYWRLSTSDYLVHHMGNTPSSDKLIAADEREESESILFRLMRLLLKRTTFKILIKKINEFTFRLLSTKR